MDSINFTQCVIKLKEEEMKFREVHGGRGMGEVRGAKERGEDAKALFPCGKQIRSPKILKE